ncbi:MAG: phosphoglucosamine mutase [candidate division Zixibacteria bacterium RBG_16_40_9]|nr:MAG: phosphoglucosamine mutase [candidate division Zixibacteria bacterium RBG_16_40_9]
MKKSQNNLIFSISGLRGIVGEGLTPDLVVRYTSAFGSLCRGNVVVGRDTRSTGEMIKNLVISSLLSVGCEVIDIGICPTPTVELAVLDLKAQGGIAITASHNPIEWNALKFINSEGMFITEQQKNKIDKLSKNQNIKFVSWDKIGKVSKDSFQIEKHISKILELRLVNKEKIREKRFKVIIDCVNGAGGFATPILLEKLGCEVIKINCQNTGTFPHPPEPVSSNLTHLCDTVQQYQADIGFANDPDADRLAIVSEKGEAIGEEYTLALATKYVLSKKKGPTVVNLSTSKMIDDVGKMYNSTVHRTRVGEANVGLKLKQIKGVIGGEGNGGVILPELHYGRDALVGTALILSYLAESSLTVSQAIQQIPQYYMIKKTFPINQNFDKILHKFKAKYRKNSMNTQDGLRIDFPEGWLHIRKSNTEPIARVIAEAKDKGEAEELVSSSLKFFKNK